MTRPTRITGRDPSSWQTFDLRPLLPKSHGGRCLDLGCGPGIRTEIEGLGYQYIGLDRFTVPGATVRSDSAQLPFTDNSFDLIVAASSFEHFPDPWSAAREVSRTLKPDGCAVISLSFLEPYHARSHFHMSHLGASKLFTDAGLIVEEIQPFEWTGIEASVQALYQVTLLRWLAGLIVKSSLFCRKLLIMLAIKILDDVSRKQRAREFLEEERFRFTAGIKLRLRKPAK